MALSDLKERIHSFRMPIKSKRLLFLVKTLYFITPIVAGHFLIQAVLPDQEDMKRKLLQDADSETLKVVEEKRLELQTIRRHAQEMELRHVSHADKG